MSLVQPLHEPSLLDDVLVVGGQGAVGVGSGPLLDGGVVRVGVMLRGLLVDAVLGGEAGSCSNLAPGSGWEGSCRSCGRRGEKYIKATKQTEPSRRLDNVDMVHLRHWDAPGGSVSSSLSIERRYSPGHIDVRGKGGCWICPWRRAPLSQSPKISRNQSGRGDRLSGLDAANGALSDGLLLDLASRCGRLGHDGVVGRSRGLVQSSRVHRGLGVIYHLATAGRAHHDELVRPLAHSG